MSAAPRGLTRLGAAALGLAVVAAPPCRASVISTAPGAALSAVPVAAVFGGGAASYGFTAVPASRTGSVPGAAVATGGTGRVSTLLGGVTDFGAGATIDGRGLFTFAAYPAAAFIPDSPADDFIGLAFTLADGLHYGYAEVAGASLVRYAYESTPGAAIVTGAAGGGAAVPEPASLALAGAGLAALLAARRRRAPKA